VTVLSSHSVLEAQLLHHVWVTGFVLMAIYRAIHPIVIVMIYVGTKWLVLVAISFAVSPPSAEYSHQLETIFHLPIEWLEWNLHDGWLLSLFVQNHL
jgi:hypothetical protein